jgi:non-specific serine/threonine protein kinase
LRAERVWPVAPLAVPDHDTTDVAAIRRFASVSLFVDRASARAPTFALTSSNALAVARICRRLDGLPLAIELAAAQVPILSPTAILARLEVREPLVVGGARDAPARHQTLHAALSWSYDLLEDAEQQIFRRCGVFSGSFSPEALAALDSSQDQSPEQALRLLAKLSEKNLVQVPVDHLGAESPAPRFRMLETTRAFALDRLAELGELTEGRQRHASFFIALAESNGEHLVGPRTGEALDRLAREHDNLRAVLNWSLEAGDVTAGLRLAGALYRYWMMRGHLAEARQWLERALPRSEGVADDVRATGFNAAGIVAGMQGDYGAAESHLERSLELWRAAGNPIRMAAAIGNLGLVAQDRRDIQRALVCFEQAEELYQANGDRRGKAISLGSRARVMRQAGDTAGAVPLFEETLEIFREVGDPRGIANALANLGHALISLRQHQRALWYLREALELRRSLGDTLGIAECLEGFAAAAANRGRARRAARLLGAATALHDLTGAPLAATDLQHVQSIVRRVQRQLSMSAFEKERSAGGAMTLDQAADFALQHDGTPNGRFQDVADDHQATPLSGRERQVAELVAMGLTNQQIAESLRIARRTIETHLEHIFAKLGVQARAEVAVWVTRQGLRVSGPAITHT